jgi:outer membrane protein OmpA-like peptidoglycan-associated protein
LPSHWNESEYVTTATIYFKETKLIKNRKTKLSVSLMIIIFGCINACAKITFLDGAFFSYKEEVTVDAGYGNDPASMIAFQIVIRNNLDPFVDSGTIFENVYFGPYSIGLDENAKGALWKKILWLEENPNTVVVIEGHSDKSGHETANLVMGMRRAASVKTFFVERGIDKRRLITVSYGEERLVDTGKTNESHAKNRRVSFSIR